MLIATLYRLLISYTRDINYVAFDGQIWKKINTIKVLGPNAFTIADEEYITLLKCRCPLV